MCVCVRVCVHSYIYILYRDIYNHLKMFKCICYYHYQNFN